MEETNLKFKLLESIGKVFEKAEKCNLEASFVNDIADELELLSGYFKVTKMQSFFVAVVFAMNYKTNAVDLNDLVEYFNCNPMKLLQYSDDFDALYSKGILHRETSLGKLKLKNADYQYTINNEITTAIFHNKPMPECKEKKLDSVMEVVGRLFDMSTERNRERISTGELFMKTRILIITNNHFDLIRKLDDYRLYVADEYLFFYIVWKTYIGNNEINLEKATEDIYDDAVKKMDYLQNIVSGNNELIKQNLIEVVEADFFNNAEVKLTEQSRNILKNCGIELKSKRLGYFGLTMPAVSVETVPL